MSTTFITGIKNEEWAENVLAATLGAPYVSYREQWARAGSRSWVPRFPLYIQFELSGRCNLQCHTCIHGIPAIARKYPVSHAPLPIGMYESIIDEAAEFKCPSIAFHNNDEPLLLPDLEKRISMARSRGFIDIILVTNATLLSPNRSESLLDAGITKINFSVDACNREMYLKTRGVDLFGDVVRNIETFRDARERRHSPLPIMTASAVQSSLLTGKLSTFEAFWNDKVDLVKIQGFQLIKGHTEHLTPLGGEIIDPPFCNGPWRQVTIRANGEVLPCCSFYGTSLVISNTNDYSVSDIWNSQPMTKLRQLLLSRTLPNRHPCHDCMSTCHAIVPEEHWSRI
jgi:radical SAM protein with 4Fe4S-binding SPASM domain